MFTRSANTITRSLVLTMAAWACAATSWAAPLPLDEAEMRAVNGGAQATGLPVALLGAGLPGLLNLLGEGKLSGEKTKLSAAEFGAAMQAAGLGTALQTGYDGQGGSQIKLGTGNLSAQAELGDFLAAGAGSYQAGGSMGSIAISNLNAGGTRLMIWHH